MPLQKVVMLVCVLLSFSLAQFRSVADPPSKSTDALSTARRYVPDNGVRQCVAGLDASQVASINFDVFWPEGHHAGLVSDDSSDTAVKAPKLIGKLLRTLQHAMQDPPRDGGSFGNENPDQLKILLRPRGRTVPTPILLRCDYTLPGSCFGPEFFAALKDVEQYRASQVRQFIRDHRAEIRSISLEDDVPVSTEEQKRLITALSQVNGHAFVFTSGSTKEFCPSLTMKDGREVLVWFRFFDPILGKHENLPLPLALWSAYLASQNDHSSSVKER